MSEQDQAVTDAMSPTHQSESRIHAVHRLSREGRWEEACLYRDEVRQQLKAEGKSRREAGDFAWEAMLARFSASPAVEVMQTDESKWGEPDGPDVDAMPPEGSAADLGRDGLWVYEHLEDKRAQPKDAPSMGAWSLLKWAREYRSPFFERILPKVMAAKSGDQGGGGEDPGLAEVERLLLEVLKKVDGRIEVEAGGSDAGSVCQGKGPACAAGSPNAVPLEGSIAGA